MILKVNAKIRVEIRVKICCCQDIGNKKSKRSIILTYFHKAKRVIGHGNYEDYDDIYTVIKYK